MPSLKKVSSIELKNELESRGYKVTYYRRPDGGIRITSINGVKYKLSEGNTAAKILTGARYLSKKEVAQRKKASPYAYSKSLPKLTKKEIKFVRHYNRLVKKMKSGVKVKLKTARVNKAKFGFRETKKSMSHALFHGMGIAYSLDVEAFQNKLIATNFLDAARAIEKSITYKNKGHAAIMDTSLIKEMDYWYDLKKGIEGRTEAELVEIINEDYKTDFNLINAIYGDKPRFKSSKGKLRKGDAVDTENPYANVFGLDS